MEAWGVEVIGLVHEGGRVTVRPHFRRPGGKAMRSPTYRMKDHEDDSLRPSPARHQVSGFGFQVKL